MAFKNKYYIKNRLFYMISQRKHRSPEQTITDMELK